MLLLNKQMYLTMPRTYIPTTCVTGVPCEYQDELDFRIIVLTYNRPTSLRTCLSHVANLDTLGDRVGVDIWIDRSKDGKVNNKTIQIAEMFKNTWKRGKVTVHIQERHAYIIGQWVDTWRPQENSSEVALILEDDIDISPLSYKWLKLMDSHFRTVSDVGGYTLQMENVNYVKGRHHPVTNTRKTDNVFLYRLLGTWGYSPKPKEWRRFQDWFHEMRKNKTFKPYVPGTVLDNWYKKFEREARADCMWEMWAVYFYNEKNLYTVYSNLLKYTGRMETLLDTNRREAGLHFSARERVNRSGLLLTQWSSKFERFPSDLPRYNFDGTVSNP